jgi:hypothetical protein
VGVGFNNPGGLAFDPTDGTLYIGTGDRVFHYTTTGTQLGSFDTPDLALDRVRFVDGLEFEANAVTPTIPEPSTITLVGLVLAAGVFALRRRRQCARDGAITTPICAITNSEMNENMEFAYPLSNLPSGATRTSFGGCRHVELQIAHCPPMENLALRPQLAVLHRSVKRPKLTSADRLSWA